MVSPSFLSARGARRGFTVIELLVVLAILGLLLGILVRNFGSDYDRATESTTKIFVANSLKTSLEKYRLDCGDYPTTAEGLQALLTAPASKKNRWRGPYLDKAAVDNWGSPFVYKYPGVKNPGSYDVYSVGRDKQDGTADDIGNW